MYKKILLSATLALVSMPLLAADYYVVVPTSTAAKASSIEVALNSAALPDGMVSEAYPSFDFNTALQVTGDPAYNGSGVQWSLSAGALPAGLMLDPEGVLTGTPTAVETTGFQVRASYKGKRAEQSYQLAVESYTLVCDANLINNAKVTAAVDAGETVYAIGKPGSAK